MPADDVATAAFGTAMVRVRDRPPRTRAYELNTDLAQDFREVVIEEAWERGWRSPNLTDEATVVVEIITPGATSAPSVSCLPEEPLSIPGTDTSGIMVRTDDMTAACALIIRGRTHVGVQVNQATGDDDRLISTLSTLAAHIEPLVEATPAQATQEHIMFPRQQVAMLRREMLAAALLLFILVALPILSDRSLWRRLLTRWARGEANPLHVDVEPVRRYWSLRATAIGSCQLALILWALRLAPEVSSSNWAMLGYLLPPLAYVAGLALRRSVTPPMRGRRRPLIRGAAMIPAVLGVLGSLTLLLLAALLWGLGTSQMLFGSGTGAAATWELMGISTVVMLAALGLAMLVALPARLGRRWAMSVMKNQRRGEGRPVLMLRTFGDDTLKLRVRRPDRAGFIDNLLMKRKERFEELVALMLSSYGPPIAVGQPGQILAPGLGAQRFTFDDDGWQDAVRSFAEESALITVFIGKTAGLGWELDLVASSGYLHKTVFLMPPVSERERTLRLAVFAAVYGLPSWLFDTNTAGRVLLAICWPLGSVKPLIVSAASADDISYESAIQECVNALMGDQKAQQPLTNLVALPEYRELGLPSELPVRRRWFGSPLRVVLMGNLLTMGLSIFVLLVTGNAMGSEGPLTRTIDLSDGFEVTSTLGGADGEGYALINMTTIVRGDFDTGEVTRVAALDSPSLTAVRRDAVVYAIGTGWQRTARGVSAVDLGSGQSLWKLDLPELTEGLAATDTAVYVTQAEDRALWVIDAASGDLDKRLPIGCTPWGVSARGSDALVACPAEGRVVRVRDGAVVATESAPVGTLLAADVGDEVVFYVPAQDKLQFASDTEVYLPVGEPALAVTPDAIAVEGVDRISMITTDDVQKWNTRPNVVSLTIGDYGQSLHYAVGSSWHQILVEDQPA